MFIMIKKKSIINADKTGTADQQASSCCSLRQEHLTEVLAHAPGAPLMSQLLAEAWEKQQMALGPAPHTGETWTEFLSLTLTQLGNE